MTFIQFLKEEFLKENNGLDEFTKAYIEAALFSCFDDEEEPLDKNYDISDIDPETLEKMKSDCEKFNDEAFQLWVKDYPESQAGHDFWFTRNHHGVGFWEDDFGDKETNKKLTEIADKFGEYDLEINDDGKIGGM